MLCILMHYVTVDWKCELRKDALNIVKLGYKRTSFEVIYCVTIVPDFTWSVTVCGVVVDQKLCAVLMDQPETIHSGMLHEFFNRLIIYTIHLLASEANTLVHTMNDSALCQGNFDFVDIRSIRHGVMKDLTSKTLTGT